MKLLCDDKKQSYFFVDDEDESILLSPMFDYEEDAIQWKHQWKFNLKEMKND